jgi:hypothetical protein
MKRLLSLSAAAVLVIAPALLADVKTTEKTTLKLEGMLGRMVSMFGGSAARDGITSTVAVKGNRLSRINDATGQIIDLSEQKVYDLDMKKKEYKVTTFEELRRRLQEERDRAEKQAKSRPAQDKNDLEKSGKEIEFEAAVKDTGQHKTIAGHDTHEVILTITGHEKGKKIEDSGGFIMTNDMWLASKIAALDEIAAFQLKYFQAVYGESLGIDPQQMASVMAMFPSFEKMASQMQTEGRKMQGTALFTTTTFESMKSDDEMKAAGSDKSGNSEKSEKSGGGGLGGLLASRLRGQQSGPSQQRSTIMTTTVERLSIEPSASADDLAVPAGFKEKK